MIAALWFAKFVPQKLALTPPGYPPLDSLPRFGRLLSPFARWRVAAIILLVIAALALRLASLDRLPMWVDEAESAINALTIFQHGVPVGLYLGMPIYENTHLAAWPENPEYRYKDISYSANGLAVYHGWVPLYAIAAALWAADIRPDELTSPPVAVHSSQQRRLRTIVPRLPAVVFGVIAVLVFYFAGTELYGAEAGMAAAIITSLSPMHIHVSQQARYFSATVLFSVVCAYSTWHVLSRQRWRDCIWGGIAFGVLFHTHVLTFIVATITCSGVVLVLAMRKHSVRWRRVMLGACITAMLVLPWISATHFLHTAAAIPAAWRLMSFPEDLIVYRMLLPLYRPAALVSLLVLGVVFVRYRRRAAIMYRRPFTESAPCFAFLLTWLCIAYLGFIFLIPAASYAVTRIGVLLLAPVTLLLACFCGLLARSLPTGNPVVIASVPAFLVVVFSYVVWSVPTEAVAASQHKDIDAAVSYIASIRSGTSTRVYANPNDHLLLTYYSGVPVQSIAPVRKEFLNGYQGDVVLLLRQDFFVREGDPIDPARLQRSAKQHGFSLSKEKALVLSGDLATLSERSRAALRCAVVVPPIQPPPDFARAAYNEWEQLRDERQREYASRWVRFPILRGYEITSITEWWTVFFFRFTDPKAELMRPNYEERLRNAVAMPLRGSNWMSYYSEGTGSRSDVAGHTGSSIATNAI